MLALHSQHQCWPAIASMKWGHLVFFSLPKPFHSLPLPIHIMKKLVSSFQHLSIDISISRWTYTCTLTYQDIFIVCAEFSFATTQTNDSQMSQPFSTFLTNHRSLQNLTPPTKFLTTLTSPPSLLSYSKRHLYHPIKSYVLSLVT